MIKLILSLFITSSLLFSGTVRKPEDKGQITEGHPSPIKVKKKTSKTK